MAAVALFNVADRYKEQYPKDANLFFTGGSAERGRPRIKPDGEPAHTGHQVGANIDLRYMGPNGHSLNGAGAAAAGDVRRNQAIIRLFQAENAGLGAVLTGLPARYGTKPISERLSNVHRDHMHFQRR